MAKKKTQSKKHKFKHVEAAPIAGRAEAEQHQHATESVSGAVVHRTTTTAAAGASAGTRDFSYVTRDLRRIMIMMTSLVALELALWGLLGHTGLGDAVYRLVQV